MSGTDTAAIEPLLPAEPAAHAVLIATDGRTLRITVEPGGGVAITISGRAPAVLDRYQRRAFVAAVSALGEVE